MHVEARGRPSCGAKALNAPHQGAHTWHRCSTRCDGNPPCRQLDSRMRLVRSVAVWARGGRYASTSNASPGPMHRQHT